MFQKCHSSRSKTQNPTEFIAKSASFRVLRNLEARAHPCIFDNSELGDEGFRRRPWRSRMSDGDAAAATHRQPVPGRIRRRWRRGHNAVDLCFSVVVLPFRAVPRGIVWTNCCAIWWCWIFGLVFGNGRVVGIASAVVSEMALSKLRSLRGSLYSPAASCVTLFFSRLVPIASVTRFIGRFLREFGELFVVLVRFGDVG